MSTQVMVTLPDDVYHYVRYLADLRGQSVGNFMVDKLEQMLPPLLSELDTRPIETLADEEIKTLAHGTIFKTQILRLNILLQKRREGALTAIENAEVSLLSDFYEAVQLRVAGAKSEAIKRDLSELS